MNYLTICQNARIDGAGAYRYKACIKPKSYTHWEKTDQLILVFEGINQFAVSSVRMAVNADLQARYVPIQMKEMIIENAFTYDDLIICGNALVKNKIFEVDFRIDHNGSRIRGLIMVSQLGGVNHA